MERFDLATFELVRIEDLVARTIYEYFGSGFHQDIDESVPNWDRKVTWDRMKDGLNKRRKSERQPLPRLEAMTDADYIHLIGAVRDYRSADVLSLVSYRDRRTHRVAPQVDHIGFGGTLLMPQDGPAFMTGSASVEFQHLDLYATAIKTYSHLLDMTARVNQIIHAR